MFDTVDLAGVVWRGRFRDDNDDNGEARVGVGAASDRMTLLAMTTNSFRGTLAHSLVTVWSFLGPSHGGSLGQATHRPQQTPPWKNVRPHVSEAAGVGLIWLLGFACLASLLLATIAPPQEDDILLAWRR